MTEHTRPPLCVCFAFAADLFPRFGLQRRRVCSGIETRIPSALGTLQQRAQDGGGARPVQLRRRGAARYHEDTRKARRQVGNDGVQHGLCACARRRRGDGEAVEGRSEALPRQVGQGRSARHGTQCSVWPTEQQQARLCAGRPGRCDSHRLPLAPFLPPSHTQTFPPSGTQTHTRTAPPAHKAHAPGARTAARTCAAAANTAASPSASARVWW